MVRLSSPQVKRVVIVHGWDGHPDERWFPWLKKELEQRGFEVIVPAMPDPETPTLDAWLAKLRREMVYLDENTYFVGHSLGCITILRFLESLEDNQKIDGAIFVAGFGYDLEHEGYKGELSSFFRTPIDWNKIKTKANKFVIIHSKDDEWVPIEHNKIYEEKLGAESLILNGYGHFNTSKLPIVLEKLLEIAK